MVVLRRELVPKQSSPSGNREVSPVSLTIKGIYGREMYETWYKMTVMLECGLDISPVITHRLSWRDYEKGFEVMRSGKCGKVILDWRDVHTTGFHLKFGSQGVPHT